MTEGKKKFFRGCLVGGAIGDALGRSVEFLNYNEILRQFGEGGIRDLVLSQSGKAEITDDTQMTLFTAEGILRSQTRRIEKGTCYPPSIVFHAYQRWLLTQGYARFKDYESIYDGWLLNIKELHERRAPGDTCLSAISNRVEGTIDHPINDRKGCGGVMRVAPAGLFYNKVYAFTMAADFAALTHGHPSGYLSAGALGYMIASIIEGQEIEIAVIETLTELKRHKGHEECSELLKMALELSNSDRSDISDIESISQLGEGWVGEEALAIATYCALKHRNDFKSALIAAVNHRGDSDSTGAITGNILGAYLGIKKIPFDWIEKVELSEVIIQIADDLVTRHQSSNEWCERYPGY